MAYREFVVTRSGGWRSTLALIVGITLALALVVALVVLAAAVAVVLLPVVAVGSLFGWWRWKRAVAAKDDGRPAGNPQVIEVDYKVIDEPR
jgi:membrane protein implicated in regulation of membrane protease activity